MKLHSRYLLNPVFLLSLGILLANDLFLKAHLHNWLTGKLSDVSGMTVLVLFICSFTGENVKAAVYTSSCLFFIFWKSVYSQPLIDAWNSTVPDFFLNRTVDQSDLFCCLILLPVFYYEPKEPGAVLKKKFLVYPLLCITVTAICATSRPRSFYGNTVYINQNFRLKLSRTDFFTRLKSQNISVRKDSIFYILGPDTFDRFELNTIPFPSDTIHSAFIGIRDIKNKIDVYIEKINISAGKKDTVFYSYRHYRRWSKKYI